MTFLGIDPGTSRVGWSIIKQLNAKRSTLNALGWGCFELKTLSHASRLLYISEQIKNLIKKYKPDVLSVEKIFFAKNAKTAMNVSEARGVILLEAARAGLKISEFTPLEVKIALTGYGRAEKEQVAKMTQIILNLKEIPESDDATDALAIALTAAFSNKICKGPTH